jgi:hypothetical protein
MPAGGGPSGHRRAGMTGRYWQNSMFGGRLLPGQTESLPARDIFLFFAQLCRICIGDGYYSCRRWRQFIFVMILSGWRGESVWQKYCLYCVRQ